MHFKRKHGQVKPFADWARRRWRLGYEPTPRAAAVHPRYESVPILRILRLQKQDLHSGGISVICPRLFGSERSSAW